MKSRCACWIVLGLLVFPLRASGDDKIVSPSEESPSRIGDKDKKANEKPLTAKELRELQARGRFEKKIESTLRRVKLASKSERPHVDDYFVVAKFQMPLATREAQLRFEVTQGVEDSSKQIADYLINTPKTQVRDFRVLTRFKSPDEAEEGVALLRKQYDELRAYQAQMLRSMKQATSMRRC